RLPFLFASFFFFRRHGPPRVLHSFPTRRSSDLPDARDRRALRARRPPLHLVSDNRARRQHSRGSSSAHGKPDLWLRRLPTRLSVDRKSTRLNSSHLVISYAVFCLKKKKQKRQEQ